MLLFQEVLQLFTSARMAQLAKRLCLNLAYSFPRNSEPAPHLFKCVRMSVLKAEAETQNFPLPFGQVVQHIIQLLTEYLARGSFLGTRQIFIFEEITKWAVLFFSYRSLKRDRLLGYSLNFLNSVGGYFHLSRYFLGARLSSQPLYQLA